MKSVFKTFILLLFVIAVPSALGQGSVQDGSGNSNSSSSGSAHGQAGGAQAAQMVGAAGNLVTGAMMAKICAGCVSMCMACPMAVQSFMNAASMMMNAGQSGNTMDALEYGIDGTGFNPDDYINDLGITDLMPDDTSGDFTSTAGITDYINGQLGELSNQGYGYDGNTGMMTGPNGTEFAASEIGDAGAMAAAGFSPSDISMAQGKAVGLANDVNSALAAKAKLASRPSVSGVAVDSAGGGGGSGYGKSSFGEGGGSAFGDYLSKMKRGLASKKKAVIAGKSKNYGGERIGVRVDNIFEMVHRRYQTKRKRNSFIEGMAKK